MDVEAELARIDKALHDYEHLVYPAGEWQKLEKQIYQEIRELGKRDPAALRAHIGTVPITDPSPEIPLYPYLDALASEGEQWHSLYVEQMDRILEAAEAAEDPFWIFSIFGAYVKLPLTKNSKLVRKIRVRFINALHSPRATIRATTINLLSDFLFDDVETIWAMQKILQEDTDWRVQAQCYDVLQEEGHLPDGYKRPFGLRLRMLHRGAWQSGFI